MSCDTRAASFCCIYTHPGLPQPFFTMAPRTHRVAHELRRAGCIILLHASKLRVHRQHLPLQGARGEQGRDEELRGAWCRAVSRDAFDMFE